MFDFLKIIFFGLNLEEVIKNKGEVFLLKIELNQLLKFYFSEVPFSVALFLFLFFTSSFVSHAFILVYVSFCLLFFNF